MNEAAAKGRSLKFGYRVHVVVRETEEEARAYAAGRGFARVASKKDSIGVCFCPLDYRSFLKREVPAGRLPAQLAIQFLSVATVMRPFTLAL